MSSFKKAMLITAGVIFGLSAASTLAGVNTRNSDLMSTLWLIALAAALVMAPIASAIAGATGRVRVAAGIAAGAGIGVVALGASCFANVRVGF